MNLHRFKKGFTCTKPERGLRSLPGAIKKERYPVAEAPWAMRGVKIFWLSTMTRFIIAVIFTKL